MSKFRTTRGEWIDCRWDADPAAPGDRRARQSALYHAYVPTPVAAEDFRLSSGIAAFASDAEVAVRELNDGPPAELHLEALARQLLRAESVASSRIEGLILSHRRLAKASFAGDGRDLTAQSVLANIRALEQAVQAAGEVGELGSRDIVEIHRLLFAGTRDEHLGGVVREEQSWIGGHATTPVGAEFVPPPHELVWGLLDDLAEFCNRTDLPAVLQAAIAHVQFETIHPFLDGNGRVGRAIILTILRRRGLAPRYLPPVSLALAADADRYVKGLTSWRAGYEEDWYAVFVDAVLRAAHGAREFAGRVVDLQARWLEAAGKPRQGAGARRLIELLPSQPIVDVKTAARLVGGTDERARLAVLRLEAAGVLRQTSVGRRSRAWESVGLFDLLDRFERELGSPARAPRATRR